MPLARKELYRDDRLSVRYVACRSAGKSVGDIESQEKDSMILPLRGVFLEHFSPAREVLAEPCRAILIPSGCLYRVSHPAGVDDDCLVIDYSPMDFREALAACLFKDRIEGGESLLAPSTMALRNVLWSRLERGFASTLEVEETSLLLLSGVLQADPPSGNHAVRVGSRMREQIDAARIAMHSDPGEEWTVTALANRVGSTPFHLSRMFREAARVTLHQFLIRARLSKALDLLLDTGKEITEIALDLGFSSHSHFTSVFSRLVGISPAEFRNSADTKRASEIRKILIARLSSRA